MDRSLKVWVISFCVVAGVTAAVLVGTSDKKLSGDSSGKSSGPQTRSGGNTPIEQTLDVQSVEKYLTVQPELDKVYLAAARSGGQQDTKAKVYAVLQQNGLDSGSWNHVRRRVEEVVIAIRLEADLPRELAELDRRIDLKKEAHDRASGALKTQLAKDIELLERLRNNTKITLHETDRELVRRYWRALDQAVPQIRPG